uniref:ABC transporter permease n=1 Tax=Ignisphaera aggregans TaxID=334771 RepID=A0A7C2VGJ3_9CREN
MRFAIAVIRKAALSLFLVVISITLIYILARAVPGDPVTVLYGEMTVDENTRQMFLQRLGLDKPIYVQLPIFVLRIFSGDWGKSIYIDRNVIDIIRESYINSLKLVIPSTAFVLLAALAIGYMDFAISNNTGLYVTMVSLFSAIPSIVWGAVFLVFLSIAELPIVHGHLLPPLVTLSLAGLGIVYKIFRETLLDVLQQPFIQTYIALGYSKFQIYLKVVRFSLPPLISALLYRSGLILAGSIAIESMFDYPGMGFQFKIAFESRDYPVLIGWGVAVTITFIVVYTLIDLLHMFLDPRVRRY